MSDTTHRSNDSNSKLSQTHLETASENAHSHLSRLDCIKATEHLSLGGRLATLDRIKHEIGAAEQDAIKKDLEEQFRALLERLMTPRTKLQASGTVMPNMQPFAGKLTDKFHRIDIQRDYPPIKLISVEIHNEEFERCGKDVRLWCDDEEGYNLTATFEEEEASEEFLEMEQCGTEGSKMTKYPSPRKYTRQFILPREHQPNRRLGGRFRRRLI